jgi:uncharacterized protein with PIN domain
MEQDPKEKPRPAPERESLKAWYPEYFVVRASQDWIVSTETAREIARVLQRRVKPRWIRFVDITGATVRLQVSYIGYLKQSTPETRDHWRRFKKESQVESMDEIKDYDVDL